MKKLLFVLTLICFSGCDSEKNKKQSEAAAQEKSNFTKISSPSSVPTPKNKTANPSVLLNNRKLSPICNRTRQVQEAILEKIHEYEPDINCSQVTENHLKAITILDLLGKSITTTLKPHDFASLTALQYLDLSFNDITRLSSGLFAGLVALKELDLSSNSRLLSFPGDLFSGLIALQKINLNRTGLRSLKEGVFSGLIALKELDLSYNNLDFLPEGLLSGLIALQKINLYSNKIFTLPKGFFSGLPALRQVDLGRNDWMYLQGHDERRRVMEEIQALPQNIDLKI